MSGEMQSIIVVEEDETDSWTELLKQTGVIVIHHPDCLELVDPEEFECDCVPTTLKRGPKA